MTQWLVEEAAFVLLDATENRAREQRAKDADQQSEDAARHERLTAMALRAMGR